MNKYKKRNLKTSPMRNWRIDGVASEDEANTVLDAVQTKNDLELLALALSAKEVFDKLFGNVETVITDNKRPKGQIEFEKRKDERLTIQNNSEV